MLIPMSITLRNAWRAFTRIRIAAGYLLARDSVNSAIGHGDSEARAHVRCSIICT
jgi:hypothetical protein